MGVLYLVRHGRASFGEADYDVLSEVGERQAFVTGQALAARGIRPTAVFSGPARRHQQTAAGVLAGLRDGETDAGTSTGTSTAPPDPLIEPDWDEYDALDVLETAHADPMALPLDATFQQHLDAALAIWQTEPARAWAEQWTDFRARTGRALDAAVAAAAPSGAAALVVTSAGPIAAAVTRLWGMPDDRWRQVAGALLTCSVTTVLVGDAGPTLLTVNDHAHLDRPRPDGSRPLLHYR